MSKYPSLDRNRGERVGGILMRIGMVLALACVLCFGVGGIAWYFADWDGLLRAGVALLSAAFLVTMAGFFVWAIFFEDN